MSVSKEEVLQAMGYFKEIMDAKNQETFALKDEIVSVESDGVLEGKVDGLIADVEGLKTTSDDHGVDIDDLKTKANESSSETISYSDVAKLFD